ncbi:hypothetical protein C8J57DRAFT_1397373 [Mycena rebaudengoi]|nr:hypothetical protein C8J57DRAFT_1397373 [Mycena rebaudengoi]
MQAVIHALVVEALYRDEVTNHLNHQHLGRALNGLLPRRGHPPDFDHGGWTDLAWLLELNQGSYNAAALAAVCNINNDKAEAGSWLGEPILPVAGNERLEPIPNAFPIGRKGAEPKTVSEQRLAGVAPVQAGPSREPASERQPDGMPLTPLEMPAPTRPAPTPTPLLAIINAEKLTLREKLKRDPKGLYSHKEELRGLRNVVILLLLVVFISIALGVGIKYHDDVVKLAYGIGFPAYFSIVLYQLLEVVAGTMYLEREGWFFVEDSESQWTELGDQDSTLKKLTYWGTQQLAPTWKPKERDGQKYMKGRLVELNSGLCVESVTVTERPDFIVPLAYHGSGVTCMLLCWPALAPGKKLPAYFQATKVGMANFPPWILNQMDAGGGATILVGSLEKPKDEKTPVVPRARGDTNV